MKCFLVGHYCLWWNLDDQITIKFESLQNKIQNKNNFVSYCFVLVVIGSYCCYIDPIFFDKNWCGKYTICVNYGQK